MMNSITSDDNQPPESNEANGNDAEGSDAQTASYPYLQVTLLFAGLGSAIGGVLLELIMLLAFGMDNFVRIGYEPFIFGTLMGFLPALFSGMVLAYYQARRCFDHSIVPIFLTGFIISALYMGLIATFLGFSLGITMVGLILVMMCAVGFFGGISAVITSMIALPKPI